MAVTIFMKRLSNSLFIFVVIILSLYLFSCSKKQEQKKEDLNVDSVKVDSDSNLKSNNSKISASDVREKFNEIKRNYENDLDVIGNTEVKFSDLTGDGNDEAILFYTLVAKGGNILTGSGLVIYKISDNKLLFLQNYNLDGAIIKSIKNNLINCIKYEYATGDPACCPSKKKPFRLKYENNKFSFIP